MALKNKQIKPPEMPDKYHRAAIIGHWRSGATVLEIAGVIEINLIVVQEVIIDYLKENETIHKKGR